MIDVNTVRWGDRLRMPWFAGQSLRTGELFRITAPFPQTWRILTTASTDAGNWGVNLTLVLSVGIGSSAFEYGFVIPFGNIHTSFEFPGQAISGFFTTAAGVVASTELMVTAQVAPVIPWQGLEVKLAR